MNEKDVTEQVRTDNPDDELCPILQCVCGAKHDSWTVTISVYKDDAHIMPCCGRRLYFCNTVRVFEVSA